jgi:hypothetical protein
MPTGVPTKRLIAGQHFSTSAFQLLADRQPPLAAEDALPAGSPKTNGRGNDAAPAMESRHCFGEDPYK